MTPERLAAFWVYLQTGPLLWLTLTLAAYGLAQALARRARFHPLVNPVAIAVALLVAVLVLTDTPYARYFEGAQFVHFLLGPATVALAVPLWRHRAAVREALVPMAIALFAGSATAVLSAVAIARLLGASRETIVSLAPKSATTPIAMAVAEKLGGLPSLTAVLVIATGILGAMTAGPLLDRLRVREPRARGLAIGLAAHGIGTARAFWESPLCGTFAGIAMAANGVATALLAPFLLAWLR
ncbi:MAG: LrgB family protein [Geminicoccaceae bacterium]|nr:LrgB family protein [Geminicoccaceae bacterium]